MGIMLVCMSGLVYLAGRRPSPFTRFTPKQYAWGSIIVLIGGILVALMAWGPD